MQFEETPSACQIQISARILPSIKAQLHTGNADLTVKGPGCESTALSVPD
jgi:hypothetical protein